METVFSYSDNGKLIGQKMARAPFDPATKFIKWVEFAAHYPHLNELNLPYRELGVLAYYPPSYSLLLLRQRRQLSNHS